MIGAMAALCVSTASEPGAAGDPNEDWVSASASAVVVLDGSTARTDTGCVHGVSWYAAALGTRLAAFAADQDVPLSQALATAIGQVAAGHHGCDLTHPGTPSAVVAVLRTSGSRLEYLVLGDTLIVMETSAGLTVVTDDRVEATARAERRAADRYPIGSPEKHAALVRMKRVELAARNRPGGFWAAAADPAVVDQATVGSFSAGEIRRAAVLTDGAARIVSMFALLDWHGVLDLLDKAGPDELIRRVRAAEATDPDGIRWPRNKRGDDATVVYVR